MDDNDTMWNELLLTAAEADNTVGMAVEALAFAAAEAKKLRGKRAANYNGETATAEGAVCFDMRSDIEKHEAIERVCDMLEQTQLHMCRTALAWHKAHAETSAQAPRA